MTTFIDSTGDIFESPAEALVDPVNCVGAAGKGLALAFKRHFPVGHRHYKRACDVGMLLPGKVLMYMPNPGPKVIYFPTKDHWKDLSRMELIVAGLVDLRRLLKENEIASVAIPALGCGLGGLDWKDVRPAIEEALRDLEGLAVYLYGPKEKAQCTARTLTKFGTR